MTIPGVGIVLIRTWLITVPESALNPLMVPDVRVAVQWKFVPGTEEVKGILVDSPEQMDLESGLLVTSGGGLKLTITVSIPTQPLEFVTVTL